ncbi:MAG: carboxypeptidase regulatory-like domain-containing protein [Caldilineaceae bacterium]
MALTAGELTGVVRGTDSTPIAAATIHGVNLDTGDVFTNTTDSQGFFSLSAPAGKYNLTVSHPYFETKTVVDQRVIAGALTTVNVPMASKTLALFMGQVRNGDQPVAGARIYFKDLLTLEATSDADGYFNFNLPPGTYTLAVEAHGYKYAERSVTVTAQGAGVTFSLVPRAFDPARQCRRLSRLVLWLACPSLLRVGAERARLSLRSLGHPVHQFPGSAADDRWNDGERHPLAVHASALRCCDLGTQRVWLLPVQLGQSDGHQCR